MSRQIVVHEEARFDAIDIAYYIAENSLEASDRFAEALDAAYEQLADMPGMGASREYGNPKLKGMRMWPIPGFQKYLIFYRATDTELQVLRVLHGSRNLQSLFAPDEDEQP
jgi:toxin ParE1/3/4